VAWLVREEQAPRALATRIKFKSGLEWLAKSAQGDVFSRYTRKRIAADNLASHHV